MQTETKLISRPLLLNETESTITFAWLLYLRWGAILCQSVLIALVAVFLPQELPILLISAILGFEIISNLYFFKLIDKKQEIPQPLFAGVMAIDVILLTLLLAKTGGSMNPFTFLYLVHVVVGAILLKNRLAWLLSFFTILLYGSLFLFHDTMGDAASLANQTGPKTICQDLLATSPFSQNQLHLHLLGMFIAYSITVCAIVLLISQIRKALENYSDTLAMLQDAKVKNEKLSALATLAAGAAHELSTPLGTIAIAAGDMLHYTKKCESLQPDMNEDLLLIKDQVSRCKEILEQLAVDAGTGRGELPQEIRLDEIIEGALSRLPEEIRSVVATGPIDGQTKLFLPPKTFQRLCRGIIKNAYDSANDAKIKIHIYSVAEPDSLSLIIEDNGCGMNAETLKRATEPFYTTKKSGKGMGLGLYLAQSIIERFHGKLQLQSKYGKGTTVTVVLPHRGASQ